MNTILIILLVLVFLFILWAAVISVGMSRKLSDPKRKTYEMTVDRAKYDDKCYDGFESYEKEPFEVTLRDGYKIHGDYYPLDPKKVVIISHGHGDNKYTGIRYLQVFRELGYTTVIYDLRGHGHNEPYVCTMGVNESLDLLELLETVKARFPGAEIGLFGLSMGCATTVLALGHHPDVKFAVADCGYGILREICECTLKTIKAPAWMYYPVNWFNRLRYGYNASDVNPINALNDNTVPICFIHGTADKTISYHHSEWMFERNKGEIKELHLIKDAGHAQEWLKDPEGYVEIVRKFLERIPE